MRSLLAMVFATAVLGSAALTDLAAQGRTTRSGGPGPQADVRARERVILNVADDPLSGPLVTNAPFSADAETTVTQVLSDGTRIEERTTARFYRDSMGRVRREQSILGLGRLGRAAEPVTTITIDPDPSDGTAYTLDPANRTARSVPRAVQLYFTTLSRAAVSSGTPAGGLYVMTTDLRASRTTSGASGITGVVQPEEALGTRQIEGVTAVGRKTKSVIPTGQIGNDRPIEITDERWESPDLRMLIRSHHRDPRTGDVEFRLTNIVRAEPPADLFMVPSDYTIVGGEPGVRVGGTPQGGGGPGAGRRSGGGGN